MTLPRRAVIAAAVAAPVLPLGGARGEGTPIRIGVLTDLSGIYRDNSGNTSVACAQQAVAEFASSNGLQAEVIAADHQNKADIGAGIARQWFDRDGVDVVMDVPNSAVALAVSTVCREKDKVFIASQAATTALTGEQCSPNTLQWTYDTYMLARSNGGAAVKAGNDTWFIIAADFAFGHVAMGAIHPLVDHARGHENIVLPRGRGVQGELGLDNANPAVALPVSRTLWRSHLALTHAVAVARQSEMRRYFELAGLQPTGRNVRLSPSGKSRYAARDLSIDLSASRARVTSSV